MRPSGAAPTGSPPPPPTSRTSTCCSSTCRRTSASPEGRSTSAAAAVAGRCDDSRRIAEFVYRNLVAHACHDDDGHPLRFPDLLPVVLGRPGGEAAGAVPRDHDGGDRSRRGAAEPRGGELAVRWQLSLAARAGAALLRGAGEGREVPPLPVAAALPPGQRRSRPGRRHSRGAPVPLLRARRAVVGGGQGRQPADRELLRPAARGADAARRAAARGRRTPPSCRRCSGPTRSSSPARPRAIA